MASKKSRITSPDAIEAKAKKLLEKAAELRNQKLISVGKLVMQHHKAGFADSALTHSKSRSTRCCGKQYKFGYSGEYDMHKLVKILANTSETEDTLATLFCQEISRIFQSVAGQSPDNNSVLLF